jgi:hypothetical protein
MNRARAFRPFNRISKQHFMLQSRLILRVQLITRA